MAYSIDINCDMGESYGQFIMGNDDKIFPYITSCNVACGFHGGDPLHLERTIRGALEYGVQVGAHPSYPDRWGFGRRSMKLPFNDLRSIIRYQIAAICGVTRALGGRVTYVKPHGALYNTAADDAEEAAAIVEAVISLKENLAFLGLAGSMMESVARQYGLPFIPEAFADRRYRKNRLVPRDEKDAVIRDPEEAARQAGSIVCDHLVRSPEGVEMSVEARSICVHGDHPEAPEILKAMDVHFAECHITKRAFVA